MNALDLEPGEEQRAIAAAIERFCRQADVETAARRSGEPFPRPLWRQLAALGTFATGAPDSGDAGGAAEICAIAEALGKHVFPGPLAATYLAIQVVDGAAREALIAGEALVSLSVAGATLLPYGPDADVFLALDTDGVKPAPSPASVEPVPTLGGETWGRAELQAGEPLPGSARGLPLFNLCNAAYLAAAALRLVADTGDYAATRKQFGRSLGEFQAVAHPLADCAIAATGAATLARVAAGALDTSGHAQPAAASLAAAASVCACRAALQSAFACHQVYGGIGVTLEGPAFHVSRRIRQLASQASTGTRERDLLLAQAGLQQA